MRPIEEANSSQVIEVISSPSCPTEWQCFYCSEYCCWYFVSDEVKQWTHPQDGKTYKKREEATCETIQTLPASSSSASSSLQEGLPMHRLTQEPVHPIILISCGWNKQGGQLLESFREKLWHRVDEVFDSWDHLNWYGTDPRAQSQFLKLYGNRAKLCLEIVTQDIASQARIDKFAHVFVCKSGHHRSVAFVELLREELHGCTQSPIFIWHLDNRHAEKNFKTYERLNPADKEKCLLAPLRKSLTSPPTLLHERPCIRNLVEH